MSSNLHQAGVKLLRLLGRNAELVMDAYLSGSLDETQQEPALLKKLYRQWYSLASRAG